MDTSSQLEPPPMYNEFRVDTTTSVPPDEPSAVTTPPDTEAVTINDDASLSARRLRLQRQRELRALGKTHGHIPGVPIFTAWKLRRDCMETGVHRLPIAGIFGNKDDGVFAVVVSGYEDDEDGGDVIIYTGAGGRKKETDDIPPKRLHFGPQIRDQSWDDPPNNALKISYHTGNPVRVVRSSKCVSQYAPVEGYRYDGLYRVTAYWTGRGKSGFAICRCRLEQLPDQPPIPIRPITVTATKRGRKRRSDLISSHHTSGFSSSSGTNIPSSTSYLDMVGPDSDVQSESSRQRRRTDQAGPSHAPDPAREPGGTSDSPQQPPVPQLPTPFAVEDTDTKTPLQSVSDRQALPPADPASLPNYKWDSNTKTLVEVTRRIPEESAAPETTADAYQSEAEDDRTAADEDEVVDMDAKNRMSAEIYDDTPERELELPYDTPEAESLDRDDEA